MPALVFLRVQGAGALTLASAGPPAVHNAGIGWGDSFGNHVERRRLVVRNVSDFRVLVAW